jgi:hypothetical protein
MQEPLILSCLSIQPPPRSLGADSNIVIAARIFTRPPTRLDALRSTQELQRACDRRGFKQPERSIGKRLLGQRVVGVVLNTPGVLWSVVVAKTQTTDGLFAQPRAQFVDEGSPTRVLALRIVEEVALQHLRRQKFLRTQDHFGDRGRPGSAL